MTEFNPKEAGSWTLLGWLYEHNIHWWQPLYPLTGQYPNPGAVKSRLAHRDQHVMFYFYTQLYHLNGEINHHALQFALKTQPRKVIPKDMDPNHWTQEGDEKRRKKVSKTDWGKDERDTARDGAAGRWGQACREADALRPSGQWLAREWP